MAKNEVVTVEETSTAVAESTVAPALVAVEQEDMMVPFLKVIQSLSEEVVPGKDKYNDAVRPGDIYDSITRTVFKNAKAVICGLKKYYAEWTPEVRGTLVGKHPANSSVVQNAVKVARKTDKGADFYQLQTKDGNDLIETYGVVMIIKTDDGLVMPAVLTLSKTSFMVGKQLNTVLAIHQRGGVPVFRLTTSSSSNSKGSWFKPVFSFDSYETDAGVVEMAKGMAAIADKILFNTSASESAPADSAPVVDDDIL